MTQSQRAALRVLFKPTIMQVSKELWSIEQLVDERKNIDPRPQYQRSLVWDQKRKQYLIDSIFRGYDIPKIFLKAAKKGEGYQFEVTDGQQRLNAIWTFFDDGLLLPKSLAFDGQNIGGLTFSKLPKVAKDYLRNFEINVSVILECESWELNDLFTRLQKGISLLPVELRNAMESEMKNGIQKLLGHKFFLNSKIEDRRFKWQDYLDHALASSFYGAGSELKAPVLYTLYSQLAESKEEVSKLTKKATTVLDVMYKINSLFPGIFKNKWGFVDVFVVLFRNLKLVQSLEIEELGIKLDEFETNRKSYVSSIEKLMDPAVKVKHKKDLYKYIQAFTREGAFKSSVDNRYKVMEKTLLGY
jgi:hypothetical protein